MTVSSSRSLARIAAAFAISTMMFGSALAGTADSIQTTVERLTPGVTYSDSTLTPALVTYIGYSVKLENVGKNTSNDIRFIGEISSTAAGAAVGSFHSSEGVSCETNAAKTQVTCSFRQFKAGASAEFAIFFKAPNSNAPIPNGAFDNTGACIAGSDCAVFKGTTFYAEGAPVPVNSTDPWEAKPVALGTANAVLVKSAVPKAGGTLFTGLGAAPVPGNDVDWLTVVQIPPGSNFTTATIEESFSAVTCSSYLAKCNATTLTIPGSFPSILKIFLRLDESQRVKGVQIRSAVLYYSEPSHPDGRIDYTANGGLGFIIPACTNTDYGPLPQPGIPCIKRSVEYTRKNAPSGDYVGDWEFEIWAIDNGRIQM